MITLVEVGLILVGERLSLRESVRNGMRMFSRFLMGHRLNDQKRSWSVCPHLSSLEGLFDYYMASGSIMILLGKCFCHDCYKMVLSRRDLTEFMESCQHLTDMRFQKDFMDPLFQTNREVFRTRRYYTIEESTQWTWVSCPHVSREGQIEGLYTKCNPIFFNEGFVTCNDCRDVIPSASLYLQTLLDCEAMTEAQLQERIIDQLYPINREVLESVVSLKQVGLLGNGELEGDLS